MVECALFSAKPILGCGSKRSGVDIAAIADLSDHLLPPGGQAGFEIEHGETPQSFARMP